MEENIDRSLNDMREYIIRDSILSNINNPEYEFCFYVYANTKYTLYLAARLIKSLGIRVKPISKIQSVYKSCNIDYIDIVEAFRYIKCVDNFNTSIITIFDNNSGDDNDFYITIIRHKKSSDENNNIAIGINWKHFYK